MAFGIAEHTFGAIGYGDGLDSDDHIFGFDAVCAYVLYGRSPHLTGYIAQVLQSPQSLCDCLGNQVVHHQACLCFDVDGGVGLGDDLCVAHGRMEEHAVVVTGEQQVRACPDGHHLFATVAAEQGAQFVYRVVLGPHLGAHIHPKCIRYFYHSTFYFLLSTFDFLLNLVHI